MDGFKTYGQLVKEEAIPPEEEKVLRLVYGLVPLDGGTTTELEISKSLRGQALNRVANLVSTLKHGGLVSTGRGRSRSVSRNLRSYSNEHSLYPPMKAEISTRWADERPHDYIEPDRFCHVLETHGAKRGRWGAPDLTLVGGKTLPFLPGKFLDVVTFEIKPSLDITGLYEALSHRTHATHAYLICHHHASEEGPDAGTVGRIAREAQRTGVGFILAGQPDDYATWEEIVPATRWHPEPESLHEFIASLDLTMLRCLRRWLRSDPHLGARPSIDFSTLDLSPELQQLAEDIYMEIPVNGSVGWKHFDPWIKKADVVEIREELSRKEIIKVIQGGGMRLHPGLAGVVREPAS